MSELGRTLRNIIWVLGTIAFIVKTIMLFTGGTYRQAYTVPPAVSAPKAPLTEAEKKAADEEGKAVGALFARAHELMGETPPPPHDTVSHQ